jgi:hypothetical protein
MDLLALPVLMHGIRLGRPVDALLDERGERLVGFEVVCGDGSHRFLPFAVADVREAGLVIASALTLLDERDLAYYRAHTRSVSALGFADAAVTPDGRVYESRTAA